MKGFQIEDIMPMIYSQRSHSPENDPNNPKQAPEIELKLMLSVKSSLKKDLEQLKEIQNNMAILAKTKAKLKSKVDPANFFQTEVHQTTLLIQEEAPSQQENNDDLYLGSPE